MIITSETPTALITYNIATGIVRILVKPASKVKLGDAMYDFETWRKMTGGKPALLIVDPHGLASYTDDSRTFYASDYVTRHIKAMALIANNMRTMLTVNSFILVAKPTYPVKSFTTEASATEWLRQKDAEMHKHKQAG